jgi:hypothetical protein
MLLSVLDRCGFQVPELKWNLKRLDRAVQSFRQEDLQRLVLLLGTPDRPILRVGPIAVEPTDLKVVGTYLRLWYYRNRLNRVYWNIILRGGMPGYSVFLHELWELRWYFEHGLNPFLKDPRRDPYQTDQSLGYPQAHPRGILMENRYLLTRAREEKKDISLKELILTNPHSPRGQRMKDWRMLRNIFCDQLLRPDYRNHRSGRRAAQEWYKKHNFYKGLR